MLEFVSSMGCWVRMFIFIFIRIYINGNTILIVTVVVLGYKQMFIMLLFSYFLCQSIACDVIYVYSMFWIFLVLIYSWTRVCFFLNFNSCVEPTATIGTVVSTTSSKKYFFNHLNKWDTSYNHLHGK